MLVEATDGKLYIPKKFREKFGSRYEMIDRGDRMILVPVSEEPLESLREEFADVDKSARELAESAHKEALEEAGR